MKTVSNLDQIRTETMAKLQIRKNRDGRKIVIGMGECGLKAGAREVLKSIMKELDNTGIHDVSVILSDCDGRCSLEPIVHIYDTAGKKVTYGNVTTEIAKELVSEHIVKGTILKDYIVAEKADE